MPTTDELVLTCSNLEDYEVISLQKSQLENGLLNQTSAISHGMHIPIYFSAHAPIFLYYDKNLSKDKLDVCIVGNGSGLSIEPPLQYNSEEDESQLNKETIFFFLEIKTSERLSQEVFDERAYVNTNLFQCNNLMSTPDPDHNPKSEMVSPTKRFIQNRNDELALYSFDNSMCAISNKNTSLRKELFLLQGCVDVPEGFLRVKDWCLKAEEDKVWVLLKKEGNSGNLRNFKIDLGDDGDSSNKNQKNKQECKLELEVQVDWHCLQNFEIDSDNFYKNVDLNLSEMGDDSNTENPHENWHPQEDYQKRFCKLIRLKFLERQFMDYKKPSYTVRLHQKIYQKEFEAYFTLRIMNDGKSIKEKSVMLSFSSSKLEEVSSAIKNFLMEIQTEKSSTEIFKSQFLQSFKWLDINLIVKKSEKIKRNIQSDVEFYNDKINDQVDKVQKFDIWEITKNRLDIELILSSDFAGNGQNYFEKKLTVLQNQVNSLGYATVHFDQHKMSRQSVISPNIDSKNLNEDRKNIIEIKQDIFFELKNLLFFQKVCVIFSNCDDLCCEEKAKTNQEEKIKDLFINYINHELQKLQNSKIQKIVCIFQRRMVNTFSKKLNLTDNNEIYIGKLSQEEKDGYFNILKKLNLIKNNQQLDRIGGYIEEWGQDNLLTFGQRLLKASKCSNQAIDVETCAKDVTYITNKVKEQGIKFGDLAGMADTKNIIRDTIEAPLIFEELYSDSPIKLSTSLLLYGPPGCGKTEIAKATAEELGLNFQSVKGPELLDKYIGASEQAVRNQFEKAQSLKPCLLFFDEFDAIVPRRNSGSNSVTDRVVNQFLCYQDGVVPLEGVFIIAVTGRPDLLDPAQIRPGRIDVHVYCGLPNLEDRQEFWKMGMENLQVTNNCKSPMSIKQLADLSDGFTFGEMSSILKNIQVNFVNDVLGKNDDLTLQASPSQVYDTIDQAPKLTKRTVSVDRRQDQFMFQQKDGKNLMYIYQ